MILKRLFKRIKLKFFLLQVENEARQNGRLVRQNTIREKKKSLILDLMTGHNIGDYKMNDKDFVALHKMSPQIPITIIRDLHSKYRG